MLLIALLKDASTILSTLFISVMADKILLVVQFLSLKQFVVLILCLFRPRKATRRQWRRQEKSTRGATSPLPSSLSTSCGKTTGYGKISPSLSWSVKWNESPLLYLCLLKKNCYFFTPIFSVFYLLFSRQIIHNIKWRFTNCMCETRTTSAVCKCEKRQNDKQWICSSANFPQWHLRMMHCEPG